MVRQKFDVSLEHRALLRQIQEMADAEHRQGMSMAVPTRLQMYGVRVPQLRHLAHRWQTAHPDANRQEVWALVEALWQADSREEHMLACYLLEQHKRWIPHLTWADFERWRRGVDNWEVSDGLSQWVMGRWILAEPASRLEHLRTLMAAEDVWSRRMALVTTAWLNRGYKGFSCPDLTLELVGQARDERHPMITKAVSWALRGLIKLHSERVAAYLEANRGALAPHVVREVENKLRTGLKSGRQAD